MAVQSESSNGLFKTKVIKGHKGYRALALTIFVNICLIWMFRATHVPKSGEPHRWAWLGLFAAELWFGLFWIINQSLRWTHVQHRTFKHKLHQRFGEDGLPRVDIFVFTADPTIEPSLMVVNTVLSVMAYNYPSEKLSVYLSDDGASIFTFYALFEASMFAKHWIPFCNKFGIEPRSPAAYFSKKPDLLSINGDELEAIKRLYEDMKDRIDGAIGSGRIPEEITEQHKGFLEWSYRSVTKGDHSTILQILIDGRDSNVVDVEGNAMPTLVYLAREKRPHYPHNFKAGAVNALIRVSSEISNAPVILSVDCDMYSNDPNTLRDVMCFFMDEENGHDIAFVQYAQKFDNISKNDVYGNMSKVITTVEHSGIDARGGSVYSGTGSFHRRATLGGKICSENHKHEFITEMDQQKQISTSNVAELEEIAKVLANCAYELNTQWGQEMGLKYGCPVEDVITGLAIQCRGWRSVYYLPEKIAFLGVAPITLAHGLIQYKRWSEGLFQIFFSKYCPFTYGHGKIKLGLQMGYSAYLLWAPNSLPTLYYLIVPSLYLIKGIPLFPKMSSLWLLPFTYVFAAKNIYSLMEGLRSGDTLTSWWNLQRIWLMRTTTSFLFSFIQVVMKQVGLSQNTFTITAKVVDDDVSKRYQQEIMEFGSSPMFIITGSLALLNLLSLLYGLKQVFMGSEGIELFALQIILCGLVVAINIPVYEAMFARKDRGCFSTNITFASIAVVSVLSLISLY
ncbi:hypothetical protein Syun_010685 [Stephania yunnanensis]|uniref:Cellulose synthase-like protein E6 n=1 Tax=Stephania yunnanensis TaxID=152371 RepID=A0AAP0KGY5_9MAGN